MPPSPGARIVTAPLPGTLDGAIADGWWLSRVGCLDLGAGIGMRGNRVPGRREHLRVRPRGREGSYCPYPRARGGAAAPAARPRQCAGRANAATADPDGITVRCGAGQLD